MLLSLPGSGLGVTVQAAPSQCSIRVWSRPLEESKPTVQASHDESTVTPWSALKIVPGLGGWTPVQLWQADAEAAAGPDPMSKPAITSGAASAPKIRFAGHRGCVIETHSLSEDGAAAPRSLARGAPFRRCARRAP